jgi:hypothetical protein
MTSVDPYYKNQKLIEKFDPVTWDGDKHSKSSDNFVSMYERINALNPTLVIDAGCGRNQHKPHIKNLIGLEPALHPEADIHSTILDADITPGSVDAVLALGSIQYMSVKYVLKNMNRIISWTRPGGLIEMRVAINDQKHFWNDKLREHITKKYNLEYVCYPNIFSIKNKRGRGFVEWTWRK